MAENDRWERSRQANSAYTVALSEALAGLAPCGASDRLEAWADTTIATGMRLHAITHQVVLAVEAEFAQLVAPLKRNPNPAISNRWSHVEDSFYVAGARLAELEVALVDDPVLAEDFYNGIHALAYEKQVSALHEDTLDDAPEPHHEFPSTAVDTALDSKRLGAAFNMRGQQPHSSDPLRITLGISNEFLRSATTQVLDAYTCKEAFRLLRAGEVKPAQALTEACCRDDTALLLHEAIGNHLHYQGVNQLAQPKRVRAMLKYSALHAQLAESEPDRANALEAMRNDAISVFETIEGWQDNARRFGNKLSSREISQRMANEASNFDAPPHIQRGQIVLSHIEAARQVSPHLDL
jgi:hypothetical protein